MADDYKSVDLALEWSKQLMALATGTLVLSGTFVKDLFGNNIGWAWLLLTVWGLLAISILTGMLFMGSLCTLIDGTNRNRVSIYRSPVRELGLIHFCSFVIALLLFAVFSMLNLGCG